MTTIHIKAQGSCSPGGDHIHIQADLDGGPPQVAVFTVADMMEPLTADDVAATVLPLIRLHARGLTRAQLRSDLMAGLTVVV